MQVIYLVYCYYGVVTGLRILNTKKQTTYWKEKKNQCYQKDMKITLRADE